MSIYKSSSLAMIPTAYKDGKLYSIRPTDGSGDFTFSRGSNLAATRVASSGYIEKGRENLLLQSNQFDTTWINVGSTLTSGQSGYNGNNAWKVEASSAVQRIEQTISSQGVATYSMYAKAGNVSLLRVQTQTAGTDVFFDLSNGTIPIQEAAAFDATITDVGNGWYRCTMSVNETISNLRFLVQRSAFSVTIGDFLYVQDTQLESSLVASDVISTTTTSVSAGILEDMPRLDYSGSCPSLLLEPQRTNKITQSEYFQSGWVDNGNISYDFGHLAPDGTNSAYKITGNDNGYISFAGVLNNDTRSVYARTTSGTGTLQLLTYFGNTNNTFTITEEWQRFDVSSVTTSTGEANFYLADFRGSSSLDEVILWGAQCEAGSYPTSYIPTYGTSQTRSADDSSLTGVSDILGQTQGTIFIEVGEVHNNSDTGSTKWFMEIRKDQNNSFGFGSGGADSAPTIRFVTNIAGSVSTDAEPAGFSNSKIAIRYTAEDFKIYQNGVLQSTIAKSIGGYVDIQFMEGAGDDLSMPIKQFSAFPTALTDSECIALTTI